MAPLALRNVATIDTLLPWHRQLIARKGTAAKTGTRRRDVLAEIRQLVGRMAEESDVGIRADPRDTQESRASHWVINDCADSAIEWRFRPNRHVPHVVDIPAGPWAESSAADLFTTRVVGVAWIVHD